MTLIAGGYSFGVPVLIGDCLITYENSPGTSLRKKILQIADNFVLGYAGHLSAAERVVSRLQSSLDPKRITFEDVQRILRDPQTSYLGKTWVNLIGWVVDDHGKHCLGWKSKSPMEIDTQAPMYAGTGWERAKELGIESSIRPGSFFSRTIKIGLWTRHSCTLPG
jgi:hypothetical protein